MRAAAALVAAGLALAAACGGAEAGRRRRGRGPKVDGVVAARACSWAPDPGGGGGALELTGVEVSQVFAVSPKRGAANATLEALAQAFTASRKPRNVALTAWPSGGGPQYLVGELSSAEAGPAELRLRLRMSAAQARASAPGFQATSCSLFLDPTLGEHYVNPAGGFALPGSLGRFPPRGKTLREPPAPRTSRAEQEKSYAFAVRGLSGRAPEKALGGALDRP